MNNNLINIKHKEKCGCKRDRPKLCKYSISKFAREMRINKGTLSRFMNVTVASATITKPSNTRKGAYTEYGKGTASRDSKIYKLSLLGWSNIDIGKKMGLTEGAVRDIRKNFNIKEITNSFKSGKSVDEIAKSY